ETVARADVGAVHTNTSPAPESESESECECESGAVVPGATSGTATGTHPTSYKSDTREPTTNSPNGNGRNLNPSTTTTGS
ncbi:hypothetical protein AAHZ94_35400, partial [Streptomyces sp. HSW2009]|uniref:hypothetical protein n=1 Tax=Streptomyces sp. HSW2009 TaxID=3142890 RepID=UPI0032EC68B4